MQEQSLLETNRWFPDAQSQLTKGSHNYKERKCNYRLSMQYRVPQVLHISIWHPKPDPLHMAWPVVERVFQQHLTIQPVPAMGAHAGQGQ